MDSISNSAQNLNTYVVYVMPLITALQRCFTWPCYANDIAQSCSFCQRVTKSGGRKAPMVERSALTEPFESGPLPKTRGGY